MRMNATALARPALALLLVTTAAMPALAQSEPPAPARNPERAAMAELLAADE